MKKKILVIGDLILDEYINGNITKISPEEKIPIDEILKCQNVGITSGASAPEILVSDLINKIKERAEVSINKVEVAEENVIFKIPNNLQ